MKIFFTLIAIGFLSCHKDGNVSVLNNPLPPNNPIKTAKAKVLEYGSYLPLRGAELTICAGLDQNGDCPGGFKTYSTDSAGECIFPVNPVNGEYFLISVEKPGYWNLVDELNVACLFEDESPLDGFFGGGFPQFNDSFVVRKVPLVNLTVHTRNTISNTADSVYFSWKGLVYPRLTGLQSQVCSMYPHFDVDLLHPGVDTVFQLPVFGNSKNVFTIARGYSLNPVYFREEKFINKTGNPVLEIVY